MPDNRSDKQSNSGNPSWTLRIATVAGIPIRLHFTLLLVPLFFYMRMGSISFALIAFIIASFGCVVLHELGHSLVALRYGIPIRDITLYPIGGVAMIEKRPEPKQEFWIALAGPAVNVLIAVFLFSVLSLTAGHTVSDQLNELTAILAQLMIVNIYLVLFNLIPAFPMDGGRVLRALLAQRMRPEKATSISAGIGQFIAILMGITSILAPTISIMGVTFSNLSLMFIAFFIYIGAAQENVAYSQAALLEGVKVKQAMMTDIKTLNVGNTLKDAVDVLLATSQHDFPVLYGDSVEGILTRNNLLKGLSENGPEAYVAGAMEREYVHVSPEDELEGALQHLNQAKTPVLVLDPDMDGKLIGIVSGENVAEFFAVRQITAARERAVV